MKEVSFSRSLSLVRSSYYAQDPPPTVVGWHSTPATVLPSKNNFDVRKCFVTYLQTNILILVLSSATCVNAPWLDLDPFQFWPAPTPTHSLAPWSPIRPRGAFEWRPPPLNKQEPLMAKEERERQKDGITVPQRRGRWRITGLQCSQYSLDYTSEDVIICIYGGILLKPAFCCWKATRFLFRDLQGLQPSC